jgi:hypothetical protein
MTDVQKIVSHVLDVPGEDKVLVNYSDGTTAYFGKQEWREIIQHGREAYAFLEASKDYQEMLQGDGDGG